LNLFWLGDLGGAIQRRLSPIRQGGVAIASSGFADQLTHAVTPV
jgi:hypothetical protein